MKQREFRPVDESNAGATISSRPLRTNKLTVSMPMPALAPIEERAQDETAHHEEFTLVDVRLIEQNANPPRLLYSAEAIDSLAESIEQDGQRDPVHLIPHPTREGRFIIGDGWTRVQAIRSRSLNDNKVLARIHLGLSEEEAAWLGYSQNEDRSQLTDYDKAAYYSSWHAQGRSWEDIAQKAGVSKTLMSFYSAFSKLPADVALLAKLNPQKITANVASILCRAATLKGDIAALRLATQFIEGDHPRKWLESHVESMTVERKRSHNAIRYQKAYGDGFYKQRADGQVEAKLFIEPERLDDFNEKFGRLLDEFFSPQDQDNQ